MKNDHEHDTDHISRKRDYGAGLRTVLNLMTFGMSILVAILGWSLDHNVRTIEGQISAMMPRHEVELLVRDLKDREQLHDAALMELRTKQSALELEIEKIRLTSPHRNP